MASEEAQASTEAIETLAEETQATNEELETINEELQGTIEELTTTVNDLTARNKSLQRQADDHALQLAALHQRQRPRSGQCRVHCSAARRKHSGQQH